MIKPDTFDRVDSCSGVNLIGRNRMVVLPLSLELLKELALFDPNSASHRKLLLIGQQRMLSEDTILAAGIRRHKSSMSVMGISRQPSNSTVMLTRMIAALQV